MKRFLITFDYAEPSFESSEFPEVQGAVGAVLRSAGEAGVLLTAGAVRGHEGIVVEPDGTVVHAPSGGSAPHIGGFAVVAVPDRDQALEWARQIAAATRTRQEVRELIGGPPD